MKRQQRMKRMSTKRDQDPAPAPETKEIREAQSSHRDRGQPYASEAEDYSGPAAPTPDRHQAPDSDRPAKH
jgi:hypothetical protein